MIEQFWATTLGGGLYRVYLEDKTPVVEKIDQVAHQISEIPIGGTIPNGSHVAITKNHGVMKYTPQLASGNRCSAWYSNTSYWGGGTSPIIGLFLEEDTARANHGGSVPVLPYDWRYQAQTIKVLAAIGHDHPYFVIDEPVLAMANAVTSQVPPSCS